MSRKTKRTQILEGDLFAYLMGEKQPHIEQILQSSSESQQEVDELRQLDSWLLRNFGDVARPDPQDLVDVVTGQANAQQRLIVASYVRKSARGRQEMEALQREFASLQEEQGNTKSSESRQEAGNLITKDYRSSKIALPSLGLRQFIATSLAGIGLRSTGEHEVRQSFQVADLQAQVTLRVVLPTYDQGQIEGYVTQHLQPVAQVKVTLRSNQARPRPRTTDELGFFTFRRLKTGVYTLRIHLVQGIMVIEGIKLNDMD